MVVGIAAALYFRNDEDDQAETNFSELMKEAMGGREVIVAKSGMPVVRITPVAAPTKG